MLASLRRGLNARIAVTASSKVAHESSAICATSAVPRDSTSGAQSTSTSASTRRGCRTAASTACTAPIDIPTTTNRSTPSDSARRTGSSAIASRP